MNPNPPQPNNPPGAPVQPPAQLPVEPSTEPVLSAEPPQVEAVQVEPTQAEVAQAEPTQAPVSEPIVTTPAQPPKNNKKRIAILATIAGALLLIIAAVLVFVSLNTVSKQDYAAAATQFSQVSSDNFALSSDVSLLSNAASDADAEFNEAIADAKTSKEALVASNDALGKLKAVKVGTGGDLYKAFDTKLDAYLVYGDGLIESVTGLRPAMVICSNVSEASDEAARVTALKACSEGLSKVAELKNPVFNTLATTLKAEYANYATVYEKRAALSDPFGDQYEEYKALRDQMYDIQDNIRDASKTFSEELNAKDDELSVKESADALAEYLNEQQRS